MKSLTLADLQRIERDVMDFRNEEKNDKDMGFIDSYNMVWTLRDDNGNEWVESFDNISLSDFETIYEKNPYHIVNVRMALVQDVTP